MQVQRIKFERTGGFAGMRMATDLKLDELPEAQADSIRGLLDDMNFEELPEQMTSKAATPDQFAYMITVETDQGEHTIMTDEASAPEKLKELLQLLNRLARTRKK
jgi:hypothetical protein